MKIFQSVVLMAAISLGVSSAAAEPVRYIVVLNSTPTATHRSQLMARRATIHGEAHRLVNAMFVSAEPGDVAELRKIPGVRYIVRDPDFRPTLDRAVQLVNVPAAWSLLGVGSNAGKGVRIGIIDSGIDTGNPAFQDSSLTAPANFPTCSVASMPLFALDCTKYTNSRVIVARSYVPYVAAGSGSNPAANSRPDDYTPRDHIGHGTAVAMAAAGGTAVGPSDTITGVAPKAYLGSYKVFGSPGVNDSTSGQAIISALEDAFSDGMDIAVLSLGAPAFSGPTDAGAICGYPAGQACDPFADAVRKAASNGMLVVAAAGNEGQVGSTVQPTLGSMSTPGDSPDALTVGASTNSHSWSNGLTVAGLGTLRALLGNGPAPSPQLNAPLADAATVGDGQACSALSPGSLGGSYVLVARGTCTFAVKVQNAQAAGAAGVIFTNTIGDNSLVLAGVGGASGIPSTFVGYDDGQKIRTFLQSAAAPPTASMSTSLVAFESVTGNQTASFSSRGPVLGSGGIKPDVTAPGTDLYLAGQSYDPNGALYSPSGFLISQGTSFSTPIVAGVAALVKQANPKFTPAQIKSAIVNTATQDVTENAVPASVVAVGNGKANAGAAVSSTLVAVPASVAFGVLKSGQLPLSQSIQLTNTGTAVLNLTLSVTARTPETGARAAIDRPSLILAPGQSSTVNLTLAGTQPSAGSYEGFVVVQGGPTAFRIPYLYLATDSVPANLLPLIGDGDSGTVGQFSSQGVVILQLLDRYGLPVPNAPVRFSALSGGGQLSNSDISTDIYGFAGANVTLGTQPGANQFLATAGGLSSTFTITGKVKPSINANGVVEAATFQPGTSVAPGSYVAIFGSNLAPVSQVVATPNLPLSMSGVRVSFDAGGISTPGHLHFVTPGQINVQVPWELAGQRNVQMKVAMSGATSTLYTLPLATYSPGMFVVQSGGASFAAARDENFQTITPSNPALQGHYIQLYCNGLGPVDNQPASGDPAPASPLAVTTALPTVTIGGQNAQVLFSGLTPGTVGLYQINVMVPNVGAGLKDVVVSMGTFTSKALSLAVK